VIIVERFGIGIDGFSIAAWGGKSLDFSYLLISQQCRHPNKLKQGGSPSRPVHPHATKQMIGSRSTPGEAKMLGLPDV
jgi:hypothetical protein